MKVGQEGFRRVYGRGPMHLAAALGSLALAGLALASWLDPRPAPTYSGAAAMPGMAIAGVPRRAPTDRRCSLSACPIPLPGSNELSVAGELGSALAAAWATPVAGAMQVRLELLNPNMGPIREAITIAGDPVRRACGPGCWIFTLPGRPVAVSVSARERGRRYAVQLPLRWLPGQSSVARTLLRRAVASMASLRGLRDYETITSGPAGPVERFHYRLSAPDRMAYTIDDGARVTVIGDGEWSYTPGHGWSRSDYGSGSFTTAAWFDWGSYDQSIQLLHRRDVDGRQVAEIALMSPTVPVWFRLRLEVPTGHVSSLSMMAGGHFMTDRFSDYGRPQRIRPPHA